MTHDHSYLSSSMFFGGLFGMVTANGIVDSLIYGAIGATVGYFVKKFWDKVFSK